MDEKIFRFLFILAALVYGLVFIGIFLVFLKILLLFTPEINIMGLTIT